MMEEKKTGSFELTDMWKVLVQSWWKLLLSACLFIGLFYAYENIAVDPAYKSTATLYILKLSDEEDQTSSDFSLALNVVSDCIYLLKSHKVLDRVIDELGLGLTYDELSKRISTNNPNGTRILEVSVEAENGEDAKRIVDKVCEIGIENISDAMGVQQVHLIEKGVINPMPSNRIGLKIYGIAGLVAAAVAYLLQLILYVTNDTITDNTDIEKNFGLSVLASIPNYNDALKKNYGYYKYYGGKERHVK